MKDNTILVESVKKLLRLGIILVGVKLSLVEVFTKGLLGIPVVAIVITTALVVSGRIARLLGVSPRTLQDWEQGRRAPSGAARTLLLVAARDPKALLAVA